MSRIDDLLAEALATGSIPTGASEAERAELAPLIEAAGGLRAHARTLGAEADARKPVARARFERFVADAARPAPVRGKSSRGSAWQRLLGANRLAFGGAVAAAVGVVAVLAVFASQALFSSTETANALSPDDYVQVQGVVTGGSGGRLSLASDTGVVNLALSSSTTTVGPDAQAAEAKVGDRVIVSGVVNADRSITATSVAVTDGANAAPAKVTPKLLKRLGSGLSGRVVLLSIAKDGMTARVIIETAGGERYLVKVDGATAEALLTRGASALGVQVTVNEGATKNDGVFGLGIADVASPPGRAITFAGVRGVIASRELNVIQVVDADRQVVPVAIRATTRILFAQSGLTAAGVATPGAAVGHEVAVSGSRDARTGRIIADVVVIGPKYAK